ncbi:nucleoside-diphosphate-sugar epimerase [Haloactinopolyspora alba]|uniref:Nucleoside-diphosphate-sugar epimerase n=1 Tax=Haloactinopolyspora alba TaxID=648780 RepID=A0A2P8EAY4_9ACTN|nr:NAD-dependent epimerase/dehydratase family protein [Haloactinopolyspora alba]PSL06629.1 nucleoside-diphosphate-sugar epimerase [Haloactinopolyspora alba]
MGQQPRPVRARRNGGAPVIAVTGAASGAGRAVASRLAASSAVSRVVAIDDERGDVEGVSWRVVDITDPSVVSRFSGVDAVVHADVDVGVATDADQRAQRNVRGTQTVLTAAAAAGVRRVAVVTSAMVYGAGQDNPIPLDDDAALRAEPDGSIISDLLEIEDLCARAQRSHPGTEVTVVRPATLVGPGVDTVLTRHFEAPRLLVVKGGSPAWQFCHLDDLAAALEHVVVHDLPGPLTVGCDGHLSQSEIEELTGRNRVELPASFVRGTAQRLHRLGLAPVPASELQFVTYPWVVSAGRLRTAGWRPSFDNAAAVRAMMDEIDGRHALAARRIGRKETAATIGAAGATVAVLGTAVAVRRARRRKRG